ncbi:MAG: DUF952 domain-containing protein [Paracoccaceae bacterium]
MIYKVFRTSEWEELRERGISCGAPVDLADGFIHFSTRAQLRETVAKHFSGACDLWLAAIDGAGLGDALRWEKSRNGDLFPHLYRALRIEEIQSCQPLPLVDGAHILPDHLA